MTTLADHPPSANQIAPSPPLRLRYLDGLRGCCAAAIVLYHLVLRLLGTQATAAVGRGQLRFEMAGHCVVGIFIVLSGYSLMIPVAAANGRLAGGVGRYARRRCRRILPAYYAALGLALLPLLPPAIGLPLPWQSARPFTLSQASLLAHLLLVYNLHPAWAVQIDAPMWSVATEAQIYILFPLVLLPVWRAAGSAATIAAGLLLGIGLNWLSGDLLLLACPWYLGLFAMGMTAADITFGCADEPPPLRRWPHWLPLCAAAAFALAAVLWLWPGRVVIIDCTLGIAAASLLVHCTSLSRRRVRVPLLENAAAVWLGVISYSLYLVHEPLIAGIDAAMTWFARPTAAQRPWLLAPTALLLVLILSYLFHRVFERPFMPGRPHSAAQLVRSAALEPGI